MKKLIGLVLLLAVVVGGGYWFWFGSGVEEVGKMPEGRFVGTTWVAGLEVSTEVEFLNQEGMFGMVVFPEQSEVGVEISDFSLNDENIYFELGSINAVFDGKIEDGKIFGVYEQNGYMGSFELIEGERGGGEEIENEYYDDEEVSFGNDEATLAGTLSIPKKEGVHPAVILISGSGPQDRDENVFGFKIFKVMADYFARNGIAVLRYDDRGFGRSTVAEGVRGTSTTASFALDAEAAVEFLKERDDIGEIGLLGHSEGGLVAGMIAARRDDIDFVVFMSTIGVTGEELNLWQITHEAEKAGVSGEEKERSLAVQRAILGAVKSGEGWEEVENELADFIRTIQPDIAEGELAAAVESTISQANNPWFKFFVEYDPYEDFASYEGPALVLFGGKDRQVDTALNRPGFEALKGEVVVKEFEEANHMYQKAETGEFQEYPLLEKQFVDGFLEFVTQWMLGNVEVVK